MTKLCTVSTPPSERRVAVPGTHNFRDIGGYVTEDGTKRTRWHRLYRADHLARVAQDSTACAFLRDQLHVTCAVDLRSAAERNQQPYEIPGVTVYRIPMVTGADLQQYVHGVPKLTEEMVEKWMCEAYERFVMDFKMELGHFFKLLVERGKSHSDGDEALVFHCKAGKDRTGVCAALLLLTLGVPIETVFEDFLLTNEYYKIPPLDAVKNILKSQVEDGAVSALFQARRSYLEHALETIVKEHQTVPNYMRDALALSDEDIDVLKQVYLVDA